MKNKTFFLSAAILLMAASCGSKKDAATQVDFSQVAVHSHNDYGQDEPFFGAFNAGTASIEADVYLVDTVVMLGHDSPTDRPIREGYLDPIKQAFEKNGGSVYPDGRGLQFMVDLKDGATDLRALEQLIEKEYKDCFDCVNNPGAAMLVITGDVIPASDFHLYKDFVFFDGRPNDTYTDEQLKRIPIISNSFSRYSHWKGNGQMKAEEREALKAVIDKVHAMGKKVRFWGFPDCPNAWRTSTEMGIDYINTDHPADVMEYIRLMGK